MALPLAYNIRNLRQRWKVTLLAIFGIGLVVAVFVTLLAMENGFRIALRSTGSPQNGIVTQRGSLSELTSWINIGDADVIRVDPRVARDSDGKPMASCEVVVLTTRPRKSDNQPANITFRGVSQEGFKVRNNIKIVEGRNFTPGLFEAIVGKKIADRVTGLNIGDTFSVQKKTFQIVGLFTADGSSFESEIWGDYDAMAPAIGRNGGCESLTLRLSNPATMASFDKEVRANPRVQLQIDSEPKYYENLAGPTGAALLGLAAFVAVVMGIGAVFGAMNTMYAIVSQRTREVGTLRALGFSRFSILFSFVLESMLLALIGGVLGCLVALTMNGYTAGTGQTQSFSEMAFAFKITPHVLIFGLIFAVVMGFIGGLLPAFRAARMPITRALREA
ncbi:MAG TPA: FtsX-like permease family protein [Terriglobales bacterium]|jgi:putative ABC transport system permease protein|nr:FtsX-like permease family protein [Terriglobales bacterium]